MESSMGAVQSSDHMRIQQFQIRFAATLHVTDVFKSKYDCKEKITNTFALKLYFFKHYF